MRVVPEKQHENCKRFLPKKRKMRIGWRNCRNWCYLW